MRVRQGRLVAALLCLAGAAFGQTMPTGTKTTDQMIVAYSAQTSPTATFFDDARRVFGALWIATGQAGLHPLGVPVIEMDLAGIDAGTIRWEAWLPLVDELDPAKLGDVAQPKLKLVPPTRVVYTYCVGMPEQLTQDVDRLRAYAEAQNLTPTTRARVVAFITSWDQSYVVLEQQLEVQQ